MITFHTFIKWSDNYYCLCVSNMFYTLSAMERFLGLLLDFVLVNSIFIPAQP